MASTTVLGAIINSTFKMQCFTLPEPNLRFSLPASMAAWQKDNDESWQTLVNMPNFQDTLKQVFDGEIPSQEISDFGFLSIVSAVLDHICSFERLASSRHPHLYTSFVSEMGRPLQTLDQMWNIRVATDTDSKSTHTSLMKSTKSLLDSVFYHLYGNHQLTVMKALLGSPEDLIHRENIKDLFQEPLYATNLEKALIRAAEALREDCRLGLKYLQRIGPLRFAPFSATAVLEGGMSNFPCRFVFLQQVDISIRIAFMLVFSNKAIRRRG